MRLHVIYHRNCFAATLVAAIACAGGHVFGQDTPLTPLTPAVEKPTEAAAPTKPVDRYAAGTEAYQQGKWSDACAEFTLFLREQSDDPRAELAHFFLGEAQLRSGRHLDAAKEFRTVLETAQDLSFVATVQFRLGEALHLGRRHAEAIAALETFLDEQSTHAAAPRAWYYLTESAFAAGRDELAATGAAYFTACYPDDASAPRVALLQAAALMQLGRTHEARTVLTPLAADAGPDRDPTIDLLAASLEIAAADEALAAGDLELATQQFSQFTKNHARHDLAPYAAYRLAELAAAHGKWSDAAAQFAAVLKQKGLSADLRPLAWLAQVQALAQEREWEEVLTVAEAAQKELSNWSRRYEFDYLRGRAHLAKAEMNEARTAFGQVLSNRDAAGTEPAALAQYMTAETHFLQRHYDAALADYARVAAHKYPYWQAAAQLQAGKCCEQLNRLQDARTAYDVVLRDYADSPFAAEARSRREACLRQAAAPGSPQRK